MFRVADIRKRTAIAPKIVAHLYTWGPGHTTAEGEHIPVQVYDSTIRMHMHCIAALYVSQPELHDAHNTPAWIAGRV
jgi:hypothetical protein